MAPRNDLQTQASPDGPGRAPRTRSRTGRAVLAVALTLALASVAVASLILTPGILFRPNDPGGDDVVFQIDPGEGLQTVTRSLREAGLIRSALALELYGRQQGFAGRLQAGRYLVSPAMAPVEIMTRIVDGDAVFDVFSFTVPEGWTVADVDDYFRSAGLFSGREFSDAAVMQEAYRGFPFLDPFADGVTLDGYLFPDTYTVFSDSTPEAVVTRMLQNFTGRVAVPVGPRIEAQDRSLHDVLTLASIVQAESGSVAEMPEVAGVFANRLRDGIPLESDATVNYALGTAKLQPTFADTRVDHPYNTYRNRGLPPGPIGNPGLPAILAALDPPDHDYYFFLHKPDRQIVLSRTFAEHLESKALYLD